MANRLKDKIAIVTGASSGIGQAIALAYHDEGAKVVCADIQEGDPSLDSSSFTHNLITSKGGTAVFIKVDVGSAEQVEAVVQKAVEWGGRLDIMVNNAGVWAEASAPIWETSVEAWDKTQLINARGVFLGLKYATAQMVNHQPAHPSGDRGWVISTASVLGLVGNAILSAYCASKGAVVSLTRAAALACAPHRIHVNCICPGSTASATTRDVLSRPEDVQGFAERLGEPEDLARVCVFLASEDARRVTGVALPVDGGHVAR